MDEGAGGHDDGIGVSGHGSGNGAGVGVYGGVFLDSFGEEAHVSFVSKSNSGNEIRAQVAGRGAHGVAEGGEDGGGQFCRHDCLAGDVGRHEEALEVGPVAAGVGAHFGAEAGGGEFLGAEVDEVGAAANVAAGGCHAAARVFDKGSGANVGAELYRFFARGEFAVAIVDENNGLRGFGADCFYDFPYVFGEEGRAVGVSAGALDKDEGGLFIDGFPNGIEVVGFVSEGRFFIGNAAIFEVPTGAFGDADDALHGVVGGADGGNECVAAVQKREKYGREGVGPGNKMRPHERGLRFEYVRPDFFEFLAAGVVVAVAV